MEIELASSHAADKGYYIHTFIFLKRICVDKSRDCIAPTDTDRVYAVHSFGYVSRCSLTQKTEFFFLGIIRARNDDRFLESELLLKLELEIDSMGRFILDENLNNLILSCLGEHFGNDGAGYTNLSGNLGLRHPIEII